MFYERCFSPIKKVIRRITFSEPFPPSEPLFPKLGLWKIDDIFKLQFTSFVNVCNNKLAPAVFDNYFNYIYNIYEFCTRQAASGDIFVERKNTLQYGIKSVKYAGTK